MPKTTKARIAVLSLLLLALIVSACKPQPIVETMTEAEFNEELAAEVEGFTIDLQPGKIVMTGETMGMVIDMDMTMQVVDGALQIELTSVLVDGQPMPMDMFEDMGTEMSATVYSPEEGYVLESVTITDNDITFVSVPQ